MITKIKKYEKLAAENGKMFTKAWDFYCIASDSYMKGFRAALITHNPEEEVEVDLGEAGQQLSIRTFERWQKEQQSLRVKYALDTLVEYNLISKEEADKINK